MKKRIAASLALLFLFALVLPAKAARGKDFSRFDPGTLGGSVKASVQDDPLEKDSFLYYDQLGDIAREIYDALAGHAGEMMDGKAIIRFDFSPAIALDSITITDYADALYAFSRDHCEVFWIDFALLGLDLEEKESDGKTITVGVFMPLDESYLLAPFASVQEVIRARMALDQGIAEAVACADREQPLAVQLRAVHDWLCRQNTYNHETDPSDLRRNTALSALDQDAQTQPVCEGYARAFKLLCDALGIPCMIADGFGVSASGTSEEHMWNTVRLYGVWYAVDVTWDDTEQDEPSYRFFLVGHAAVSAGLPFAQSHVFDPLVNDDGMVFDNHPLSARSYDDPLEPCLRKVVKLG